MSRAPGELVTCGDAGDHGAVWLTATPLGVWISGDDGHGGDIGPWLAPWADVLKHAPARDLIEALAVPKTPAP